MDKPEVLKTMMNSENGGLYAAIGGIVLVYGIDRVTRSRYMLDVKKDSITLVPAGDERKPQTQKPVNNQ